MAEQTDECNECVIDPEQMLREKIRQEILEELARQDFVHVTRCGKCEKFKESQIFISSPAYGWCERYDEPKTAKSYCSEGSARI